MSHSFYILVYRFQEVKKVQPFKIFAFKFHAKLKRKFKEKKLNWYSFYVETVAVWMFWASRIFEYWCSNGNEIYKYKISLQNGSENSIANLWFQMELKQIGLIFHILNFMPLCLCFFRTTNRSSFVGPWFYFYLCAIVATFHFIPFHFFFLTIAYPSIASLIQAGRWNTARRGSWEAQNQISWKVRFFFFFVWN